MLRAMRKAEKTACGLRRKPFLLDVEYLFIEKNRDAIAHLKTALENSEFRDLLGDKIHLICDDFVSQVPKTIEFVERRGANSRAIFFLDQFGYTDVPLPSIRTIFSRLSKAEIILTFATDFLIDYLTKSQVTQGILARIGLSLPAEQIETARSNQNWQRAIQFALHEQIPNATGADHYTPFFIRSPDSHRDFWLIHLSRHSRARDVMVGLHWERSSDFVHYGGSGLRMLGYDPERDPAVTGQKILPEFCFDAAALASSKEELMAQFPSAWESSLDSRTGCNSATYSNAQRTNLR